MTKLAKAAKIKESKRIKLLDSNKIKKMKEIFLEWSLRTDLNCYTKIFVYRQWPLIGLIWLFILLVSSGITFWLIAKSISEYFNYSIVSQIGIVSETKSVFPTVTICDKNPLTTREAEDLFERVAQKYNLSLNDSRLVRYAKILVTNPSYSVEEKRSFGLNLGQFISCSFKGETCDMNKDFNWLWSYVYGNCWQFNSGRNTGSNLRETYGGNDFGLSVSVSLDIQNKYLLLTETLSKGLIVFIHNSSFYPHVFEKHQAFVETDKDTYIAVKRIFNYKMPRPYSKCIDLNDYSSDLFDFIKSNRTYRQTDCFRLCRHKLYSENCGCNGINDDFNFSNKSLRPCDGNDLVCMDSQQYNNFCPEECEKKWCPLECDSIEYDLKISSLVYSSRNAATLRLFIYYQSLDYTFIRESPQMTELDLFANIGGTLGLFISASIFTLFEIIEILVLVFQALFF